MTEQEYNILLNNLMGRFKQKKPDIPARIVEESAEAISRAYANSYKKLFTDLLNQLEADFGVLASPSYQAQLKTLQMIESRMKELDSKIMKMVTEELEKNYVSGNVFHTLSTETINTIEQLKGVIPYSDLNMYKMEQIVKDTMEDLLFSTQHTSKELKKYVREVFGKNLQYYAVRNESQNNIKKILEKELSKKFMKESLEKKGFVGIVDSSGRRWNTKNYVDMAVKTKMNQAYTEGLKDRAIETGYDLAVIPEKGAKDSCLYFEGIIISLTGETKGYMTYDQLQATGLIFHPRCSHSPYPIGSVDLMPEEDIAFHNSKVANLKNILQNKKKSKK